MALKNAQKQPVLPAVPDLRSGYSSLFVTVSRTIYSACSHNQYA
ncbi:hypothetical protein AEST_08190 [Alishewanella aestuarii B11]|uniref:Uncharacterized protein n=1 Tax=Alishewanella aestuarii B11 TaxID=1197174 RepID=J1Q5S4_9ALTE|nr:hypothetical protein AEST_08190 [Alishewanella aestuarii B11]